MMKMMMNMMLICALPNMTCMLPYMEPIRKDRAQDGSQSTYPREIRSALGEVIFDLSQITCRSMPSVVSSLW